MISHLHVISYQIRMSFFMSIVKIKISQICCFRVVINPWATRCRGEIAKLWSSVSLCPCVHREHDRDSFTVHTSPKSFTFSLVPWIEMIFCIQLLSMTIVVHAPRVCHDLDPAFLNPDILTFVHDDPMMCHGLGFRSYPSIWSKVIPISGQFSCSRCWRYKILSRWHSSDLIMLGKHCSWWNKP